MNDEFGEEFPQAARDIPSAVVPLSSLGTPEKSARGKRDRAYKRSLLWFCLAAVPLFTAALMGRPGASGAVLLGSAIAMVGVYELMRGAE